MLKSNTILNENTQSGSIPEDFKIEAPKLYEAPDYTIQEYPAPTNPYERKGFGFDPSNANKEDFIKYVYASKLIRERGGDEMLRRGGVMNALYCINKNYRFMPAKYAYEEFFGGDIPIDQAEAELDRLYDIAANSEDALGKFLKLDDAKQEEIIRQNIPGGKKKKAYTATGSSGGAILVDVNNPNFDYQKGREEYLEILRAKNIWEGYLRIRNAFSPDVVRDAMRFKTATDSRSNAAEAVLIKMREKGPEYRTAFLASLDALGVNIIDASDHNILRRAFTRISEGWTDSGVNMADSFYYSKSNARVLYGIAEEMGLVDKNGNLTEDASKLDKLRQAYESSQNADANRALGSAGGWTSRSSYKNSDVKKLFEEGKENIETRRLYRNLRANLATQYNYSGEEWKTLEDMLVYGEYTLRAIGVGTATLAATKNPLLASFASVPMMFTEETARMYSELRLDAGLSESQASLLAMQYGVAVSAAEQLQLGRFMGSFVGKSAAKSFKEYVFNNFKGGVKKAIKESALETGVELSQNTYDLATKIFAAEAFGAGFNTDQLLDNYIQDFKSAALITPLITTFIFGVGAPFRFSGTLSNVGANYGTVAKAIVGIKPSEVVENTVKTVETMRAAGEYEALVKNKYGATEQGRDFLFKYLNAKDSVERNSILQERFPDSKERSEAKLLLENFKRLDNDALKSILRVKLEAAQKREAEAQSILKGDTTDISALDAETTDEAGNISYEILDSAIDALGMRDEVIFVNNAQELAQASGMTLNAAEDVISRKGAKGFFDEKNGKIVIIKSHFASGADALQSFAHEYGHKIMANIRKNDINGYKRMCLDVLELIGGESVARASLPASYSQVGHANYAKDSLDVAEESLMRILEQVALKKVLDTRKKSVWARFKGWFQKLFSEKSLADITNERLAQIALDVLQKEKSFNVSVPNTPSKNWRAKTPEADGVSVSGEWEVVDAGDLKTSLDAGYDDALQPRNRSRQSSKEQVLNIANNLDPELLDNDPRTSDGAPIVDSRSMAVSGNGRILAIRQAYESGKAEEYRKHVLSRANSMGIDVPAGIKNPVLIRRVKDTGNMSIEELAARSNKSSVAGMSVAEQAVADGRRISEAGLLDIFFPGADGNILAESNRDFNNAFLNLVGGSETFRNKDGSLRTNLSPRVRAAVLAAMLNSGGNRDIVERLLDNPEGYNALINGLMQCAANLAELSQKPQYDISGELSQAVELYIEMHDKGQTVAEFEAQPDMFREQPSAEVMFLCRLFEANQKSSSGISGVLKEYAAQCKKIDTTTADLFGEEDPSKLDKLQAAYDHYATDLAQGQEANARWKIDDPTSERVEKLKNAKSIEIGENSYEGLYELNAKSAREYVLKELRGKEYINADTGDKIEISQVGARKLLSHDRYNEDYLRSFAAIPQMIENSIFLGEEPNEKGKDKYDKYRYYACGLKIGSRDYTARLTIGESEGKWYYDQALTEMEKGDLIERLLTLNSRVRPLTGSPYGFIDNRLISLLQENSSKKWREVSEPSPEEIAEANRQKADVKAKWTNPDGSMKKGYMLAPNGKPTNLTEDQWLLVRTPNFKKWFGDWEKEAWAKAAMDFLERTAPVANLTGQEFQKDGVRLTDKVSAYFNSIGNVAHNEELGDVVLDLKGVEDSIAHGVGRLKSAAFTAVPEVIKKGFIFNRENNWKERGWDTAVIVAPIKLGVDDYICEVIAKKVRGKQRFYLHEVEIKKTLDGVFKSVANNGNASQVSKLIIGKHIAEVKGNVSKVVDENGEPLAVYHGTPKFDRFSIFKKGSGGYLGPAIYFTNLKAYAQKYENKWGDGGNLYDVFISLKRPLIVKSVNPAKEILKTIYGKDSVYDRRSQKQSYDTKILSSADIKKLQSKGYDGVIWEYGGSKEYAVYDSSKIKSATDNIGTYSENPDIRWREVSEPIKQKFSSGNTSLRQIAAGFKKIDFKPGTTNFDLGGGKFDEGTKYLETKGVKNFVFDPVNRDSKTNKEAFEIVKNGGFDTTTCNNVLNVISEANVRDNIILQAAKSLRPNGTAYFTVYEGDGSGKGRQSQKDSWQEHRKTVDYLGEIKKHFGDVSLKNKVITARKPILLNEKASWFMDDSFENPVRWKDDADISDISAKVKKIIDSISDKKNKHIEVLRKISDTEADFLLKKTGLDLKGYSHSIDNYSILHILKKHGSEKELQRGQIPVTIKDIQNFPTIVSDYDDVKYAGKSKIGRDTIRFEKNIGDNLVLVFEEMRIGKKLLALSTMYIQKRKKLTSNANASSNTSETLSTSSDFQESANTPENQENNSRLKALLRQERSENPVIWASIVLAREILLDRAITNAKIDKVLPPDKFDGTKRQYALDRAKHIAEHCKATQENYANRLDEAVKLAEIDVYWKHDVMEEMYRSYRKDGEEYGIAKQRLLDWIKSEQRKDLENVKGLSSDELGIDVPAAIENALQEEPARKKKEDDSKNEPQDEELESFAEDGIDDEILGSKEKLAPSSLREIIDKIRIAVTKKIKALGGDEQTRRRLYRNTLAEVLKESANNLTFGREREAIMKKIAELSQKGYAVIKIKEGERTGQKIDNYTLRAEHIALRIFNRGVRDTKKELTEKFEKIVSRKGKKPSRMMRDDKRPVAGAVQMRVYNIKRYSEMDAAELEAEYSATVDRLENVEKNFAEDAGKGEVRSDIEDIRAEVANAVHDMKMFGNWRDKSRAQMAEGVEFLEKYIDEETEEQKARVEARKEENARRRNVFIAALRQSKRNANKDGELRKLFRGIVNNTLPFDSILSILGEAATGKTYAEFKSLSNEIVSKVNRAAENVSNECFAKIEKLYAILRECYGEDQSTALRRLLKADAKYERFSKNPETPNPMTLANVMQLYATALQTNYQRNIFEHRIRKSEEYEKIQKRIDEIELKFHGKESKSGAEWKIASEEIETLERERDAIIAKSVSDYISELEGVLTEADKKFVAALRAEYAEALPALSAVSRRVIGLPIEQADELYMPAKVDYGGGLGEGTGGVPVVPKSLSPRVSHLRDFDETADPITLYLERVKENAQFKYFSELYIELRGIFADESLQKLIRERCGADVLKLLKESIADICTGETKGFNLKAARQASGLFAIAQLGWNFGSGVRQFLPGVFSWGAYIGTPAVLRNCASFFTPEGFRAALEIAHSETGRRRFAVGNMQIIEEMLEKPDQNRFWRLYKRYALIFNRSSDMLAIMFVGQGVYRTGVENYLRKGFTETEAKKRAMSDMWQIAERSQASGKIHNMSAWQRRGGDLAKAIGMFSSPPQLMFAKATQDMRRAIALGIKTPEGRAAAWNAAKTLFTVSVLVEGSYAASTVLWNALLKGYFDDDDDEYILKSMLTGPFGGLFLFGRLVDSLGTGYSPSAIPMEGLARPAQYTIELVKDIAVFDWDEAIKDLDKLASSTFSPWRDLRKILKDEKK